MPALKIRRGLEANRAVFTAAEGELLCATDTRVLYLGDGTTAGGNIVRADAITFNGQAPSAFATAAQGTKANTAYGWGDHSAAGYQTVSGMPSALSDFTNDAGFITDYTVTQTDVTAHQAALVLTKSQISDLGTYSEGSLDAKLDLAGGTMTGALNLSASASGGAGLNLGVGDAPTAPVNGDMWITATTIQARIAGTTRTLAYTNSWATIAQAEAEAGASSTVRQWNALRVKQAIVALSPVKADGTGAAGTWGIAVTGNAGSADVLSTARNIALTGGVTGNANFDGSGNISISATVVNNSHSHIIGNVTGLQTALDGKQPLATVLTNTTAAFTTALATKLNGIETGADVTDTANVTAAGALMDSDFGVNGIMRRTAAGTYSTVTDNSGNWNTAYGWGNHATAGYTPASRTLTAGTGLTGGGSLAEDRTFTVDKATAANLRAGAADKVVTAAELYTANAAVSFNGPGTVHTPDFAAGRKFGCTLTAASTLGNPLNQVAGQEGLIYILQGATGGNTLAYGTAWQHLNGVPTIKTAAYAVNVFAYYVMIPDSITLSYLGALA